MKRKEKVRLKINGGKSQGENKSGETPSNK